MGVKEENINKFIYAMINLMVSLKKGVEHCCAECGDLSEKELTIIIHVGDKQDVKMSDIADSLSTPLSTLTSIMDKLVVRNYLVRYPSNEDRRVIYVTLASKGKETYNTFLTLKKETANKVLMHFKPHEQDNLIKYLEKLPPLMN